MTNDDTKCETLTRLMSRHDLFSGIGLLTRLPIRVDTEKAMKRGAYAAWSWPLVGIIPASLALIIGAIGSAIGLPALWVATLAVVAQVMVTGAMHEDGLADTADGLWGGATKQRRLDIMKDSAIGAYGVIALVLSILLRVTALAIILPQNGAIYMVLVTAIVSRGAMVSMMAALPNARGAGLSKSVGDVPRKTAFLAIAMSLMALVVLTPSATLPLLGGLIVVNLVVARIASQKIGGQTGDILGASQQISEITCLALFSILIQS